MQGQISSSLKNIVPKAFWGCHKESSKKIETVFPISDHEVVFVVGSRLAVLDHIDSNKSKLTYFGPRKVTEILLLSISSDRKFVAASVRILSSNASMLIHQIDKQGVSDYRTPRLLQNNESNSYAGICFSADSGLIAAFTDNRPHHILIYDRIKEILIRSLDIGSPVTVVSFSPDDNCRICTTGTLLQFWRYTTKAIYNAPIIGLHNRSCKYTCHVWLPDRRVVVGTDAGELVVVHQSSVQTTHHAFGATDHYSYLTEGKVVAVLADEYHVIAASSVNSIGVFEILPLGAGIGTVGSLNCHPALLIKAKFKLGSGFTEIRGIQLNVKSSSRSGSMLLAVTQSSIYSFELSVGPTEIPVNVGVPSLALKSVSVRPTSPLIPYRLLATSEPDWADLSGKSIYCFHSERIDAICLSTRSSSFVTASVKDRTVRVWDFTKPFSSPDVTEYYGDRTKNLPCKIDMHPSGWTVACANNEGVVSEFAITLFGLTFISQIVATKIPFVSSDGTSYALSSPVSIVKYSNGGHLLAVVCGKLIQLFHLYDLDYSRNESSGGKQGRPKRVMAIAGHGSTISDIVFSTDDCRIFSCSVDGTVYSHVVSVVPSTVLVPFLAEYVTRGGAATKIVTSQGGVIIVHYDSKTATGGYLAIWHDGRLSDSPMIVQLDMAIRDIALGRTYSPRGDPSQDLCLIGTVDGSLLVSVYPLPTITKTTHPPARSSFTFSEEINPLLGSVGEQSSVPSISSRQSRTSMVSRRGSSPNPISGAKGLFSDDLPGKDTMTYLDFERCRVFHLHCGPVSSVAISADGNRMFSTGDDGAVFMLSVSSPSRAAVGDTEEEILPVTSSEMLSESPGESTLRLADTRSFEMLRINAAETLLIMEEKLRDTEKAFSKLSEQTEARVKDLEARLKREVSKRDAIILNERDNHQKQKQELTSEISSFEEKQSEIVTRVELGYEQRLAQEALYLDRMRQAYEEMALHTQLDRRETKNSVSELHVKDQNEATANERIDTAKQREFLLTYVGYVNARHDEILSSLEKEQEKERLRHKTDFATLTQQLEKSKMEEIKREMLSNIVANQLSNEVAAKEDHLLRMKNDLDWAQGRADRLELALQQATFELKKRTEMYEKWEFKAGDQQQQISEMERIRKALTVQILGLRQEIGPKEEKLLQITEKLQEMDREYDMALKAVSNKEQALIQKSISLSMLQKQVRDLRFVSTNRDISLKRAAVLFEQYRLTLETAGAMPARSQTLGKFNPNSVLYSKHAFTRKGGTSPLKMSGLSNRNQDNLSALQTSDETVTGMSDNFMAFQRLRDMLRPHLSTSTTHTGEPNTDMDRDGSDSVVAYMEKEKQVKQLHKNVNALKTNLEKAHTVFELKAKNQLNDNEHLLKEVNDMRHEIRKLSADNHRLKSEVHEANKKKNPRVVMSSTLPLGTKSRDGSDSSTRHHFEGAGEDYSWHRLHQTSDRTNLSLSERKVDSDLLDRYDNICDDPDAKVGTSSVSNSADDKISLLMSLNENVIKSERVTKDKRTMSDSSSVAQDILSFHQQRERRNFLVPENVGAAVSPGKSFPSAQANLSLHTNNLQLPAVLRQSARIGR